MPFKMRSILWYSADTFLVFEKRETSIMSKPYLSIVVPVYNEEENLEPLYLRLTQALDAYNKSYELIFVNDGSSDQSEAILDALHERRPEILKIIHFNGNFGQHMAIMAGFERVRGRYYYYFRCRFTKPTGRNPEIGGCHRKRT